MWVRKLTKRGDSIGIVLPTEALTALLWEQGDMIHVLLRSDGVFELRKFPPETMPDRLIMETMALPEIQHV